MFSPEYNPMIIKRRRSYWNRRSYLLAGSAYFGCCVRQHQKRRDPSHWFFGHLPLFTATTLTGVLPALDHVIFHQCPDSHDPEWPLANAIIDMIDKRAYEVGLFSSDGVNRILVAPPGIAGVRKGVPDGERKYNYAGATSPEESLICAERLFFLPGRPTYIGTSAPSVIDQWRRTIDGYLSKGASNVCGRPRLPEGKKKELPGCKATCSRSLRVAVWQRSDRLITNIDEVEAFLGKYTDEPVARLTASEDTPPDEQMMNFRCFDVLIAVHGSQLTGMIFTHSSTQVFIEIQALPGSDDPDDPFCKAGRVWSRGWKMSYGHSPVKPFTTTVDEELTAKWEECFARVPVGKGAQSESYMKGKDTAHEKKDEVCNLQSTRYGMFHDRLVDLEYLEEDFEEAVRIFCGCGKIETRHTHRCGLKYLPEARLRARAKRRAAAAQQPTAPAVSRRRQWRRRRRRA